MKKIIIILTILLSFTYKAQDIYPLNTYYEDVPNYSYMKDLDNDLPPYIGTYKANYQGNEITLIITKEDKYFYDYGPNDRKYYQDVLHIKYIVKNIASNTILEDNINIAPKNTITSIRTNQLDNNSLSFYYSGTRCMVGWGEIKLKKINDLQFNWSYYPNGVLLSNNDCPNSNTIKVYLPDTKNLVFTKQ